MREIIFAISLLLIVIIVGTLGYMLIQNWSLFDSFYMTIITIGTVGFREVNNLNMAGRLFTIIIIVVGIGIGGYAIANVSAFIIEGHIQYVLRGRRMEKQIEKLKNHIIVCGYGKTGIEILDELKNYQKQFVIIENDE